MGFVLKNINIIDKDKNKISDVFINDGIIEKISENIKEDVKTYDCKGLSLMPSFVDLHVHFRDPGLTHKEDIKTGSMAALKGGYTLVNLMANTKPIANDMEVVDYVLEKSKKLDLINIHQCASVTENFDGESLDHLDKIDRDKVVFISDDGKGIISNLTSYKSMLLAKEKGFTIMTHAEDKYLTPIDYRISENVITARDLYLCYQTGARLHMSHVSTKEALDMIRMAKSRSANVSCEVTPHHIALYDNDFRVNPPIRKKEDVLAVIEAIKDETVDAISTDHAPHTKEDKENGAPGLVGLETAFSVCYTSLVKKGHISINRLSALMSYNPYQIFRGLYKNRGLIEQGYTADLVIVDLNKKIKIDSSKFESKGKNTPFDGMEFFGEIKSTIKDGKIKYDNFGF